MLSITQKTTTSSTSTQWWEREDRRYQDGRLFFGGEDLLALARTGGTPLYAYNAARIRANLERLRDALESTGLPFRIFYAVKANRFLPLVTYLRQTGLCGIDVCSPNELLLARQVGFAEEDITFTGTSLSNEDLDCLQMHEGVWINCDSISSIRRLGERCPGRAIGIRINPELGTGYNRSQHFAGDKPTKFGIYKDRFEEALIMAGRYGLKVTTLHFHLGSGYLTPQLETLDQIFDRTHWFLDRCPDVHTVDLGGGMGVPMVESDIALDLDRWAGLIARHYRARGLRVQVEPGDYLVKDAGALLLQVNTVERKKNVAFVGVNGGAAIQYIYPYYKLPYIIAPLVQDPGAPLERVTIAGQLNESLDLFAEDVCLPQLFEGDYLALFNVGGYGSSTSSNHCMRGQFSEYLLWGES